MIYLLINAAYLYLLPVPAIAAAERVAATAAQQIPIFGAAGAAIIAGIVMVSCFGSVNGSMMTGPRVFFAMSDRGLLFPVVARVSPRFRTPSVAIWLAAALAVTYVLQNSFAQLADRFVLGTWPFYALAVAGRLHPAPQAPRPAAALPDLRLSRHAGALPARLGRDDGQRDHAPIRKDNGVTFGIILAGVPVYWVWRWWEGRGGTRAAG